MKADRSSLLTNFSPGSLKRSSVTRQRFSQKTVTVPAQSLVWFSVSFQKPSMNSSTDRPVCVCVDRTCSAAQGFFFFFLTWKNSGLDFFLSVFRFCERCGYYYIRVFDSVKTFPYLLFFLVCDLTGLWPVWVSTFFFFFNNKLHSLLPPSFFLPPPLLFFFPQIDGERGACDCFVQRSETAAAPFIPLWLLSSIFLPHHSLMILTQLSPLHVLHHLIIISSVPFSALFLTSLLPFICSLFSTWSSCCKGLTLPSLHSCMYSLPSTQINNNLRHKFNLACRKPGNAATCILQGTKK